MRHEHWTYDSDGTRWKIAGDRLAGGESPKLRSLALNRVARIARRRQEQAQAELELALEEREHAIELRSLELQAPWSSRSKRLINVPRA
jgi:hypothetical protein